jgi:anthranilate phosphoribosyltransferase
MKEILNYLFEYKNLTKEDAKNVLTNIAQGKYSNPEIASFISVYLMRNVSEDELSGFRDALLELCIPVDFSGFNTIDVCGTGGDERNTFNISTLTSFVVAAAGGKVAKHGNYSVSSSCGSSNVLEFYGYRFSNDQDKLKKELEKTGICFLHAPLFNPAMKNVAPVRKSLRMKTFFNMLGPMVNPSFPENQVIGVFSLEVARLYNYIYQRTDKNYAIIYSIDGYDEISLTGDFKYMSRFNEAVISPASIGFDIAKPEELFGGDTVEEASQIFINVLENKCNKSQKNVVIVNAAYALKTLNPEKPIEQCIVEATQAMDSGEALNVFKQLINMQ